MLNFSGAVKEMESNSHVSIASSKVKHSLPSITKRYPRQPDRANRNWQ